MTLERLGIPPLSALVLSLAMGLGGPAPAAGAVAGSMAGLVTDERGAPQMGAAVLLLTGEGRSLRRVYTNDRGGFLIDDLFPGLYGIRVSLPSFLPLWKEKILIRAGTRSYLEVQLAALFGSIQLVYPGRGQWPGMSEDWKWVLRTASSTRPVFRHTPWEDKERQSVLRKITGALGEIQGLVQLNAGDGGRVSGFGSESDLGTAFAVATSLLGNHNLSVSGNLGYGSMRGAPSAGFQTSYSRAMPYGAQPEVSVTVRQLFLPGEAGRALFGPQRSRGPALQTFSLGFQDRVSLGDLLKLEYGFVYDSISFLDRLTYLSSFGKLSQSLGEDTQLVISYTSGLPRPDPSLAADGALGRNLSSLGLYPRMSLRGGRAALQRGEHLEVGLQQIWGDSTVELAAYRDNFSNTALTAIVPGRLYAGGDILPDLFSDTASFNAGSYHTTGYRVSYSRRLSEHLQTAVAYGLAGALAPGRDTLASEDPGELRSLLRLVREHSVTVQANTQIPQTYTRVSSSYQWGSRAAVTPADLFSASANRVFPGMNLSLRQPLPQSAYLPGKFEATAEFRNLLAQGYVPIRTADGRRLFLIQSARSFRGGFNFVF